MPTIACPYCNAPVPVPEPQPAGRVSCPRCGEDVPVRPALVNSDTGSQLIPTTSTESLPPSVARPSNRTVARVILGVMALMAAITLAYALHTTAFRRSKDIAKNEPEPVTVTSSVPPAEWATLGYLPDDVQAIAGLRLSAALETEGGRTILAPLGLSADDIPF